MGIIQKLFDTVFPELKEDEKVYSLSKEEEKEERDQLKEDFKNAMNGKGGISIYNTEIS